MCTCTFCRNNSFSRTDRCIVTCARDLETARMQAVCADFLIGSLGSFARSLLLMAYNDASPSLSPLCSSADVLGYMMGN